MKRTVFIGSAVFLGLVVVGVFALAASRGASLAAPEQQPAVTATPTPQPGGQPSAGQPCPHGADAAAMREHMDAVHGPGSFDQMMRQMGGMHGQGHGAGMMGSGGAMMR